MKLNIFWATLLFALTVLTLILLRPLTPIDETRYVAAAWEMHQGGSYFVPHLNGNIYGHKPPLLFWLINLAWAFAGVSEFAARLVAPAFATGCVVLTGLLARRLWPSMPARGGMAALILATSPAFLLFGSATMFDTMLGFATLGAMLALWRASIQPSRGIWLALGAAIAFGVYAKGPVILIHVLPVALTMPLWSSEPKVALGRWYRGVGLAVLVSLGLVALWLIPALIIGGEPYQVEVLWRQSAGRMADSFAHQRPFWFFAALIPFLLWPFGWTGAGLRSLSPRGLIAEPATRFLLVWFLAAFLAFSLISGKQTHYIVPELPALALLLSRGVTNRVWRPRDLWLALPLLLLLVLLVVAATGALPALQKLDFRLPIWALAGGLLFILLGIAGFLRLGSGMIALAALPLALVVGLHFGASPFLFAHYDMKPIGAALAPYDSKGIAITDGTYHAQLNFAARVSQPIAQIETPEEISAWQQAHPQGVIVDQAGTPLPGMRPGASFPYRSGQYTVYQSTEDRK